MKRCVDIVLALCALALLSPLMLATAAAVLLDTGPPAFFRQRRVGRGGREFAMYKFRSMVANAQAVGSFRTAANDARITRIGAFIRRSSLDELPQLFNVLRGDMSLVGPRPDVPAQRSQYDATQWSERCSVRPGITGLAQALLRSSGTEAQRLALDLRYVRERSFWLDLRIMGLTLRRLRGQDAN